MQQEPGVRKWEGYPWNHGESHRDSEIVGESQRISQKGEDVHGRKDNEARGEAGVSYSQVYQWVKHYEEQGEAGLDDRRGKRKSDDEVDELERLRRENLRLKAKLQESERLNLLLKKVKEFEGR